MTFFTEYKNEICDNKATFSAYLVAPDEATAKALIYDRNLGERIRAQNPQDKLSPAIKPTPAFFHWLTFLTFVASRFGIPTDELVSDGGIIHEMVHQLGNIDSCGNWTGEDGRDWPRVLQNYKNLLTKIGYGPPEEEKYPTRPPSAINYQI